MMEHIRIHEDIFCRVRRHLPRRTLGTGAADTDARDAVFDTLLGRSFPVVPVPLLDDLASPASLDAATEALDLRCFLILLTPSATFLCLRPLIFGPDTGPPPLAAVSLSCALSDLPLHLSLVAVLGPLLLPAMVWLLLLGCVCEIFWSSEELRRGTKWRSEKWGITIVKGGNMQYNCFRLLSSLETQQAGSKVQQSSKNTCTC